VQWLALTIGGTLHLDQHVDAIGPTVPQALVATADEVIE
jgi:hypothetical protein